MGFLRNPSAQATRQDDRPYSFSFPFGSLLDVVNTAAEEIAVDDYVVTSAVAASQESLTNR